jgi:hypothetical protein
MRQVIAIVFGLITAVLIGFVGLWPLSRFDDQFPVIFSLPILSILGGTLLGLYYGAANTKLETTFRGSIMCFAIIFFGFSTIIGVRWMLVSIPFLIIAIIAMILGRKQKWKKTT